MAEGKAASGVRWLAGPEDHDYPAAASYLSLLASPAGVDALVAALKAAKPVTFKAKDILRAAGLALLPVDNAHVASDLKKIKMGKALAPILLVPRGSGHRGGAAGRRRLSPGVRQLPHRREHRHPLPGRRSLITARAEPPTARPGTPEGDPEPQSSGQVAARARSRGSVAALVSAAQGRLVGGGLSRSRRGHSGTRAAWRG